MGVMGYPWIFMTHGYDATYATELGFRPAFSSNGFKLIRPMYHKTTPLDALMLLAYVAAK